MKGKKGHLPTQNLVPPPHGEVKIDSFGEPRKHGGKIKGKAPHARADKRARGGGIHIKPSHKGLLHKDLGVGESKKIPAKKLEKAEKSKSPAVRKRAVFAENAKHWEHG